MSRKSHANNPNNKPPRELPEINKEYQQFLLQAGALQYELKAKEAELNRINQRVSDLVTEGNTRSALDKQKAPAQATAVDLPKEA